MAKLLKISPIQKLADVGSYAEGLEAHHKLANPTSNDDRWAGICLWNLGRIEDAKIIFTKAKRRGENGALIGLASICRLLGELEACETHLNAACATSLRPDDWVRALRERGDVCIARGQLKAAVESYSEARLEAELCSEAKTLIPVIDQSLGFTYHLLGNDRKAKELLDRALLSTNPLLRFHVHTTRMFVCIYSGDFLSAENSIKNIDFTNSENTWSNSLFIYYKGIYKIILKNYKEALFYFYQCLEISEKNNFTENDFFSKLGICKVFIAMKQFDNARTALKRGGNLKFDPRSGAFRDLTAGVLWANLGQLEKAYQCLSSAQEYFQSHDMARELGWSHLHLAVWRLKNGDTQAVNENLETVADIAGMVGSNKFLLQELRLIQDKDILAMAAIATPYALHALEPALEDLETTEPEQPTVREYAFTTFGKLELLIDGAKILLTSAAKTFETLAYLLIHPKSTLEKILTDVFEESEPKAARNHFHQIKHQFGLAQDGLQIEYDRESRTYSVKLERANLSFDYAQLMHILDSSSNAIRASQVSVQKMNQVIQLYQGAFLTFSDNEWVREIQQRVEWLIIHTGLKVVQKLFDAEDFQACQTMIEHLRTINPFDENLNTLLVLSTSRLDGALVGQHRITQVEHVFQQHNEMLPATLQQLKTTLKKLN